MIKNLLILSVLFISFTLLAIGVEGRNVKLGAESGSVDTIDSDSIYSLEFVQSIGVPKSACYLAYKGYIKLKGEGHLNNDTLLTLIDFSKPSDQERFFVLDIKNKKLLRHTLVAHGKNSGVIEANEFSNQPYSNKSSIGLFVTGETYIGKHGRSLRIDGMTLGLNDNVRKRAVVVHGASYVSHSYINKNGRLGRSFGCPALPLENCNEIIDIIKGGSCFFIYHPSLESKSLNSD